MNYIGKKEHEEMYHIEFFERNFREGSYRHCYIKILTETSGKHQPNFVILKNLTAVPKVPWQVFHTEKLERGFMKKRKCH